ncbi:MAG: type II toxin-antitoxin system RelE/ParE family toxin [Candidatus Scalindua sp.]
MAKEWTIKAFVSARGTNEIKKWLDTLPVNDQAKIDARIRHLEITKTWGRPYTAKLKGYTDLHEIIVFSGKIQYRPIGCRGPNDREFTILIGAIEKGGNFVPRNAPDTAYARSKSIAKEEHTIEYEY